MRCHLKRNYFFTLLCVVSAICHASSTSHAQDEEIVIMKIFVNKEDKGEYFFLLINGETVYFKAEDLKEIGLKGLFESGHPEIGEETYVSLNSFKTIFIL